MARIAERQGLSPLEFLSFEREQPTRHEYFHGDVFAMAGGSVQHNALSGNVIAVLHSALPKGCAPLSSDQRVGIAGECYVYPDVSAVCGPVMLEEGTSDVLTNPTILVEVLSASTEQYDRGLKWEGYQRISSLTDYLLVSQAEPRVEHFQRDLRGTWIYRAAGPGDRIKLANGAALEVDAIFSGAFNLPGDA